MKVDGTYQELIASSTKDKHSGVLNPAVEVPYRMRFSRGVAKALYVLLRRANIPASYDAIRTECEIHCGSYKGGIADAMAAELLAPVAAKFNVVFTHNVSYEDVKKEILSRPVCESTFVTELTLSEGSLRKFAEAYLVNDVITAATLATSEADEAKLHQYVTLQGIETEGDRNLKVNTSWSCSKSGSAIAVFNVEVANTLKYLSIKLADSAKPHFNARCQPDDFFTGVPKLTKDDALVFDATGATPPLGVGSYGVVYKGSMKHHDVVAVKVVDTSKVDTEILLHELAFACSAPNIVHSFGYSMEMNSTTKRMEIAIAMEALGGSLTQVLEKVAGSAFRPDLHLCLAIDILNGVAQLAEADLVHRDLKPGNFLFGMTGLKIADLGSAAAAAVHRRGAAIVTPGYLPPEAVSGKSAGINTSKASCAWDMYSAGILLRRLVTGETIETLDSIRAGNPTATLPPAGENFKSAGDHAALADLVLSVADRCTLDNPDQRLTAKAALMELHHAAAKE